MRSQLTRRQALKATCASLLLAANLRAETTPADAAATAAQTKLKSAPPALETDVLVVGAGPSGIPAAITAARQGARVVLLEEDPIIGGAPVDMYVTYLCGGPRFGIYQEMVRALDARHDLSGKPMPNFKDGYDGLDHWYLPSAYIRVLTQLLRREQNVTLISGARVTGALVEEAGAGPRRVVGAIYETAPGHHQAVRAKVTIDATGTGALADLAGAQVMYGREAKGDFNEPYAMDERDKKVMTCTQMFISQRIRPGARLEVDKLKIKGVNESGLSWYTLKTEEFKQRNTGIYLHWGSTVHCRDTRDPVALGEAQREAIGNAEGDLALMEEMGYAVHLAPRLGVRECRRIRGEHVITMHDLKSGKMPEDYVAVGDYWLDIWGHHELTEKERALPRFGIPYRALVPKGLEGLLVAGKAISGTHIAISAYRVQPIVGNIGQGAGLVAALAAARNTTVRDAPVAEAQTRLRAMGLLG